MKILFTLQAFFICVIVSAQPITINSTDIPIPAGPFNNIQYSPISPPAPSMGDSMTWDYSTFSGSVPIPQVFSPESDVFFTNAGIDVQRQGFKDLNTTAGYEVITKFDFNSNGVYESGLAVPFQAYELSAVTGSTLDSLIFPDQKYLLNDPITVMQFPFTAQSSWHSSGKRSVDFNLTVGLFSLNNAPGQQVYTKFRNDSIVGWGKMRVYTLSGPSIWYDVLMNRFEEYSIDSFYLNGTPASQLLLDAFSVAQGQKTNVFYGYDFIRAGSFNYLVRVDFAADSTYSFVLGTYQNMDNIVGVDDVNSITYSSVVYPNPVSNDFINVLVKGIDLKEGRYVLSDMTGKRVQEGDVEYANEIIKIRTRYGLMNGTYFLTIQNNKGDKLINETIEILR